MAGWHHCYDGHELQMSSEISNGQNCFCDYELLPENEATELNRTELKI